MLCQLIHSMVGHKKQRCEGDEEIHLLHTIQKKEKVKESRHHFGQDNTAAVAVETAAAVGTVDQRAVGHREGWWQEEQGEQHDENGWPERATNESSQQAWE